MRVEYESEDDAEPIKVVIRFYRPSADVLISAPRSVGVLPPPAPWSPVFIRDDEYDIKNMTFTSYPDDPELDWVEVLLA